MLRAAVKEGSDLGKAAQDYMDAGDLVPDDVIIDMILQRIDEDDARDGFILDGFPRTTGQADALAQAMSDMGRRLTAALLIEVPDEEVVKRLSGRRVSVKTGRVYHVDFDPPKHEGRDDIDGSRLIQRDDDKPETIRHRLGEYHEKTEPLIEYYEERGLLRRFDGTRNATEVHDHIRATLATLRLEEGL
jgi:adenylate kinase